MAGSWDATLSGGFERALAYGRGDRGVLGVLRRDHVRITSLLHGIARHLDDLKPRAELLKQVGAELRAHCSAEARVLYTWRKGSSASHNPIAQAEREHDEILHLLGELEQVPDVDPGWRDRFEVLQRLVALHFQDEEDQLFSAVREALSHGERKRLAEQYRRARDAFEAPH